LSRPSERVRRSASRAGRPSMARTRPSLSRSCRASWDTRTPFSGATPR
jgi:hypothetical protein